MTEKTIIRFSTMKELMKGANGRKLILLTDIDAVSHYHACKQFTALVLPEEKQFGITQAEVDKLKSVEEAYLLGWQRQREAVKQEIVNMAGTIDLALRPYTGYGWRGQAAAAVIRSIMEKL